MNILMIFVLFFIFVFIVTSRGNLEPFSSDEAIQNLASLYNQKNLTVTQMTTPKIIGQPTVTLDGNVIIPGTITSPSLDTLNANLTKQIDTLNAQIKDLNATCVKKNTNFTICDQKWGKCIVGGDNYDGNLYHQAVNGRANGNWKIT